MISLPNVTLICLCTRDVEQGAKALVYSSIAIGFGAVKLVSHYRPPELPHNILYDHVDRMETIDDWNRYLVYDLWKHFDTEFVLIIHPDGFVVNPHSWRAEFLQYDYIGSAWSYECAVAIQGGRNQILSRVGNSVGIRSRKLCKLPSEINLEWRRFNNDSNEDTFVSCHCWNTFAQHGCTKAPLEVAILFGREEEFPENQHITEPFIFHKWFGRNHIYPRL